MRTQKSKKRKPATTKRIGEWRGNTLVCLWEPDWTIHTVAKMKGTRLTFVKITELKHVAHKPNRDYR